MKMYGADNKRKKKKKKKAPKPLVAFGIALLIMAVTVGSWIYGNVRPPDISANGDTLLDNSQDKKAPDELQYEQIETLDSDRKEQFYNILIVGTDLDGVHTDSIMIASFDVKNKKVNVLSIPRDTISNVSRNVKKINSAFSIGGVDKLYKEIKMVTGFKPDKYVVVSTQAFVDLIDAIGGVEVDVQMNMKYSDPTQDLYIDIKQGKQTLNGYDSMCFMRYRYGYAEGDIGRVRAQHQFISALMDKLVSPATIPKIPELCEILIENVETDLTLGNLIWLGKEAMGLDLQNDVNTYILPGYGEYYEGLSYYFLYKQKTLDMINETFNPYLEPITSKNVNIFVKPDESGGEK